MHLHIDNQIWDFDLDLLRDVTSPIDTRITEVEVHELADALGDLERLEHLVGLGFVACQAYLTSTLATLSIGRDYRQAAFDAGPRHTSGLAVAAILNHGANYWKHHPEWEVEERSKRGQHARAALDSIGYPAESDYPLANVLYELVRPQPTSFAALIPQLEAWRDALRRRGDTT